MAALGASSLASAGSLEIKLVADHATVPLTLADNSAVRDLLSRLPLEIELQDFGGGAERIFYPKPELDTGDVERGFKPQAGDIAIFGPWGNVALFLKDANFHEGLIRLGSFDKAAIPALKDLVGRTVRLERIDR